MKFGYLRPLCLSAVPLALAACANPGPDAGETAARPATLGVDLGGSSRIPHIAGRAGEGHPAGAPAAAMAPGTMPGESHSTAGGMPMDHSAMPGMRGER